MAGKYVLHQKDLPEKAAAIKIFKYSSLGQEFKKQNSVEEKQYQKFDHDFKTNEKEKVKIKNQRNRAKSSLVHNNYFTFYKYRNNNEFVKHSLDSKLKDFKGKIGLFYHYNVEIKPHDKK